ncbi:MAG: PD-(D/E)XK nuclease family protein [Chloroflexia bacterium]|nr:PD-(D/E)XK nuclease family protein [Chloroflexia bacterium]
MSATTLPAGFRFSQTALRTYLACPYRFRLRYLERVPWPSFPPNPAVEAALELGRRFHELARQHYLGLDVSDMVEAAGPELAEWWACLQTAGPELPVGAHFYPEAGLSIPWGPYRLAARYDLLAVGPQSVLVVDWKTGRGLPPAGDVQSRVYLYVLSQGGRAYYPDHTYAAEDLALLYWHPQGPRQQRRDYSAAQQAADHAFLQEMIGEIAARPAQEMQRVEDPAACRDCAYTALCGRPAGSWWEWEAEDDYSSGATSGRGSIQI